MPDAESVTISPTVLMDADEARQYTQWINQSLSEANSYLLEVYEREGWKALGYDSFVAYGWAEIHVGRSRLYQLLRAETVEHELLTAPQEPSEPAQSTQVDSFDAEVVHPKDVPGLDYEEPPPTPRAWVQPNERQMRELQELLIQSGPQAVHQVWGEIQDEYGPNASAAFVREKVQARLPRRTPTPPPVTRKERRDAIIPHLKATTVDDALLLQGRWETLCRFFTREWAVVPAVECARALPKRDLAAAAEHVTHMATWISEFNAILEERRGRATD